MADSDGKDKDGISRRSLLGATTIAATIPGLGLKAAGAQDDTADQASEQAPSQGAAAAAPYNVILIITDEEAYHLRPAEGYALPARDELKRRGTTLENHYIGAAMCTPSRGVMFSGQPPQVNGVYDQMEAGYVPQLLEDSAY
ncbi:MAG: sulfatase-like hydrolase/transferase [Pseudomonadota bacterium]